MYSPPNGGALSRAFSASWSDDQRRNASDDVDRREVDHHHAAIGGDLLQHRIGDIARMIIERARTRMRKHDWRFRHAQRIEHRRLAHVTQIDQHAEAVELAHHRLAELGEPVVLGIVSRGIRPLDGSWNASA